MKRCSRCRGVFPFELFYKKTTKGTFGRQPYCKACSLIINKTPAAYARVCAHNKARYKADAAFRQSHIDWNRRRRADPEYRERLRLLYLERRKDPDYLERYRQYYRERYAKRKAAGLLKQKRQYEHDRYARLRDAGLLTPR